MCVALSQIFLLPAFAQRGGQTAGLASAQPTSTNPTWDKQPVSTSTPTGPAINSGSKNMGKQLLVGAAVTIGTGYLLTTYGQKLCSTGYGCAVGAVLIGMGAMSLMQGKDYVGRMGSVNNVNCLTSASDCSGEQLKALAAGGGHLSANGDMLPFENKHIKVDPKNQKIIDKSTKKEYPFSAFGSTSSMAAAGLGNSSIEKAMQIATDLQKKAESQYSSVGGGFDEGGSGGNSNTAVAEEDSTANINNSYGANSKFRGPVSESANVAGLSKSFNGNPIGVSADDIFKMMNRRYLLKDKQESFLDVVSAKPPL